jgi:hypothetical protein
MKTFSLNPTERQIVEEAFGPYIQAVTIVARLRGLNPGLAQLTADRTAFVVRDEADLMPELNGAHKLE